ncbi:ATP-binding cassette domain-containing protein [Mucilaginibacter agri]|uniref:ATP-binding cassette domain-containing protein n=1 Tax=Mucilaginibacter agri TaxID=2695265 RepID=A0A965ZGK8_9SPHI|nr:ATP-binding cassette domain-containing protein [Mucilaginibacter agri]NCD69702.1 ATP-binding cassette domain-containing protein [Mucilaginibacter agri]
MISISIRKKLNMAGGPADLVVDAELPLQNITALYGPSGSGKTSLLKIIAGLTQPDEGFIQVNNEVWLDTKNKINLPPQKRNIGFVFQDYALFPNMTVEGNLRYACSKNVDEELVKHLLVVTGLTAFANHKPATLSGGQKQRVALARALVRKPSLLLLDEPLSALDNETRLQLQQELLQFQKEYKFSALLVSHDIAEIYQLAKSVISIDGGKVLKVGRPAEVFGFATNAGQINLIGQIVSIDNEMMEVLADQRLYQLKYVEGLSVGDKVCLAFADVKKIG